MISRQVQAPEGAEDRWRAEVWVDGRVRTLTSHLWISRSAAFRGVPGPKPEPSLAPQSCGTSGDGAPAATVIAAAVVALALAVRRRD